MGNKFKPAVFIPYFLLVNFTGLHNKFCLFVSFGASYLIYKYTINMPHSIQSLLSPFKIGSTHTESSTGSNWYASKDGEQRIGYSPVDGLAISALYASSRKNYDQVVSAAQSAALYWRTIPAPKRGQMVLRFGRVLEENKEALGKLVSYEMGKSLQEGLGEVQEMIDICYFAQGISRQIGGLTLPSERPLHQMIEQYHPLGIVGIISAFNFPVAVWAWNAALAWVCGDVCIWKPSEKTPLTAIACQTLIASVLAESDYPEGISNLILGARVQGEWLASDQRIPLISATGSVKMGKQVGVIVAGRLGRSLLELGGNNAIILTASADIDTMLTAIVFGAVGTAGQRCTSTRRLIIHENIYEAVKIRLVKIYGALQIGDPLDERNHIGPLIDKAAVDAYLTALTIAEEQGAVTLVKGELLTGHGYESGCYVKPAILEVINPIKIVETETFAPLLYILRYSTLAEAIALQNNVPQGLSSAIMTTDLRESGFYLSAEGSDCGIANVNIGTSGAEIGGAFGGEKETGGGRESGSDAWKNYMRRQTNTINYGDKLPLAQGIKFEL